ncbi:hypothetical protein K501DRAFT_323709 [Backusella circina FSU 941]|nr:hypothetical protein K501DRAFT_323709 [Backusella circina FSU 941]
MLSSIVKSQLSASHKRLFSSSSTLLYPIQSKLSQRYANVHVHENNNKYAISYASNDNSIKDHPELIIGWTPDKDSVDPRTFIENTQFIQFLTDTLKENIHKLNDPNLKALADWQKEGWLHVGDERNPPPWGRINTPEDIIGSVELKDGKIKPHTYQPMPAHRMVTNDGLFQLSDTLAKCIIDASNVK